jgi:phosphoribosylaminoimidazolecarboxamide formyltransferase/IMP cyclohydrolase
MSDLVPIRRALLSVSDKSGLLPLARALAARGVELISTGGTAKTIADAGIPVLPIEKVTGFPEMMDGRVKTLHPKVHGGILALRDNPAHVDAMRRHDITPIDLVCVNLYPFEETIAGKNGIAPEEHEAIEQIDIGGPSMVRSASKNFGDVVVLTGPHQYERFLAEFSANGTTSLALRRRLAAEAFARTSSYDAAITAYLSGVADGASSTTTAGESSPLPAELQLRFEKAADLRYGENPHQKAALYRAPSQGAGGPSVAAARQLHGKELGYNNICDADAALALASALADLARRSGSDYPPVAACVIKHANPSGASLAASPADAIDEAIAGDPLAAYGGIVAVSAPLDEPAAERLCAKDVFMEVVVAPSFTPGALDKLRARWQNVRLLEVGPLPAGTGAAPSRLEFRPIAGGLVAQTRDDRLAEAFEHRAGPPASPEALRVARFLEPVCRALLSNTVCIGGVSPARPGALRLFGAGAGQMDRVTSCRLATEKAGALAKGAVAFSDAFFPFPDGPEILINAGVRTIVHPGGAKRDQETFDLCTSRGVTCLTTGLRHFRH